MAQGRPGFEDASYDAGARAREHRLVEAERASDDALERERRAADARVCAHAAPPGREVSGVGELSAALREEPDTADDPFAAVRDDLEAPMAAIFAGIERLATSASDPSTRACVDDVHRASARLNRLVTDLLDAARIEGGTLPLTKRRHDVGELLRDIGASYTHLFARRQMTLVVEEPQPGVALSFDRDRIVQLVSNLLSNALRFGNVHGTVTLACIPSGDSVELSVTDDGPGIDRHQVPHLFERFANAGNANRRGLGLGLYLAKKIAQAHDGDIWIQSEEGKGTSVRFTLPADRISSRGDSTPVTTSCVVPVSQAHGRTRRSADDEESDRPDAKGLVLVADDEPALTRLCGRVLTDAGFIVHIANDGASAAKSLETQAYDAIVSDISMPGMGGLELLRVARQFDLDVPVVLMTGHPAVGSAVHALELGAYRYLIKPFGLDQLEETVGSAVLVHRMAKLRRRAVDLYGDPAKQVSDRAGLEASLERALAGLWMAFQPIVRIADQTIFGYEALMRSTEPTLPHPGAILEAAERLGRLQEVGRAVRAKATLGFDDAPDGALLFVNLHASDLCDDELFDGASPLSTIADRVVLEITERASLDAVKDARARIAQLRGMGFRVAVDDLGAGYAGLTSFAQLQPEVVKLDMSLVRGVASEPTKRKLIRSMTQLCSEMGMLVVAEGIETREELETLREIGCNLMQGYLFARPGRPFPAITW